MTQLNQQIRAHPGHAPTIATIVMPSIPSPSAPIQSPPSIPMPTIWIASHLVLTLGHMWCHLVHHPPKRLSRLPWGASHRVPLLPPLAHLPHPPLRPSAHQLTLPCPFHAPLLPPLPAALALGHHTRFSQWGAADDGHAEADQWYLCDGKTCTSPYSKVCGLSSPSVSSVWKTPPSKSVA